MFVRVPAGFVEISKLDSVHVEYSDKIHSWIVVGSGLDDVSRATTLGVFATADAASKFAGTFADKYQLDLNL